MLPFDQLQFSVPPADENIFERMMTDLVKAELGGVVQRHGKRGQDQYGVDIHGTMSSGGLLGVQCKKKELHSKQKLTVNEVLKEVRKAKRHPIPLEEYRIVHTGSDDGKLQREALRISQRHSRTGHFRLSIEGWDTIKRRLSDYPAITQEYWNYPPRESSMSFALAQRIQPNPKQTKTKVGPATVLPPTLHHAFGLLAAIQIPFTRPSLEQLFPKIDWKTTLKELAKSNHIVSDNIGVSVPSVLSKKFFSNPDDQKPFDEEWVEVLEPLRFHVDTGIILLGVYGRLLRHDDMFEQIKMLAESVEPGEWTEILLHMLRAIARKKHWKKLKPQYRIVVEYCMALCLSRTERSKEAREWTGRLRRTAVTLKDSWYRAEADLLEGSTYDTDANYPEACRYFQLAADRAKRHRHYLLQGHALGNMVAPLAKTDPTAAERILKESIKAKKRAGEVDGGLGALMGQGHLFVNRGDYRQAERLFARTAKLARKLQDETALAVAEFNVACTLVDQDKSGAAVPHYKAAIKLAEKNGQSTLHRNAIHGLATCYVHLKKYSQAEKQYRLQFELETNAGDLHNAVIAQHNIGVMQLYLKQYAEARKTLKQSEELAIKIDDTEWMYYSARHQAFSFRDEGTIAKATTFLSDKITYYRGAKQHVVAAWLAEDLTHLWLTVQGADAQVLESHRLQVECWLATKEMHLELWNSQSMLFAWLWDHGHFDEAMASLRELTKLAEKHGMQEQLCRCWDQYGTNLQQLNRFEESEQYHKKALKLASRLKESELLKNVYNNLGEFYRKTGELKKAERLLKQCELVAVQTKDMETRISSAHNRALIVRDLGRPKASKKLLEWCMKLAKKHSIWDEYVRAILGLANHAYQDGETRTAVKLYRQAIQAATKYEDNDHLWQARLNLAGLYRTKGNPEKAIEQLELAVPYFVMVADGDVHFGYLAECYEETKNYTDAKKNWTLSLEMATKVGASEGQLFARVALAKTAGRLRGFAAGQAAFEQLFKSVQPEEKARVCRGAVELAVECEDLEVACKWANKIGKVAIEGQDSADLVDTYLHFADALWEHPEHRNAAVEFCMLGQIHAFGVSFDAVTNACMHLLWKLKPLSQTERDDIENHIRSWLGNIVHDTTTQQQLVLLFVPFSLLKRIDSASVLSPIQFQCQQSLKTSHPMSTLQGVQNQPGFWFV